MVKLAITKVAVYAGDEYKLIKGLTISNRTSQLTMVSGYDFDCSGNPSLTRQIRDLNR
jgi:hypothetical protein